MRRLCKAMIAAVIMVHAIGSRPAIATVPSTEPSLARGHSDSGRYDTDGPTSIDLFSGNLMLSIPLGHTYPIDHRLDYQFGLHYNAQIWDFAADGSATPVAHANAGLGFDFGFGRLLAPTSSGGAWVYIAKDGSPHPFFSDLHWDAPDTADPGDHFRYTRNGSYLRLDLTSTAVARIGFPDGTVHEFTPFGGAWRLHKMTTVDGAHQITISYAANDSTWTVTDSHGRLQVAHFIPDPAAPGRRLLHSLDLAAFGGARAIYTFGHDQIPIPRACSDPRPGVETVSVLTSIVNPVGFTRTFTYYDAKDDCLDGGRLATAMNESAGVAAFDYGAYTFPSRACEDQAPAHETSVAGVVERQHRHPLGQVLGTWTYDPQHTMVGCAASERRTVVETPLSDRFVYYFGAGGDGAASGDPADFALPVSDVETDPAISTAGLEVAIARRVYDCAEGGGGCQLLRSTWEGWTQDDRCVGSTGNCTQTNRRLALKRTVFHDDGDRFRQVAHSSFDGLGNFRTTTKTSNFGKADFQVKTRWFNPEAGLYPPMGHGAIYPAPPTNEPWLLDDASHELILDEDQRLVRRDICYDAFGRRVRERRRGTSLATDDVVNVEVWAAGNLIGDAAFGGATQSIGTDANLCALSLPSLPVARRERTWSHGTLITSRWLEPDGTPMPFYEVDRDIDANTGLVVARRDSSGLETTQMYDLLGRLTAVRPEANGGAWLEIRHREPDPTLPGGWAGSQRSTFHYANGTTTGTPLSHRTEQDDVFGRRFLDREWEDDASTGISRILTHNALGHRTGASTAFRAGEGYLWHQWLAFDPFGRPRLERPTDGTDHDVAIQYFGDRRVLRIESSKRAFDTVAEQCFESPVQTEILRDGQGRRWIHRFERSMPQPGETVEVERHYQPDGTLRFQETRSQVGSTEETQRRAWTFDRLNNAIQVQEHRGSPTNPRLIRTITYGDHDVRGLHGTETHVGDWHPAPGSATARTYDAAGRLLQIVDAIDPSHVWKAFTYGITNGTATQGERIDRRLGKLIQATRHNYSSGWASSAHHTVEDEYVYRGVAGRRSNTRTTLATIQSTSVELQLSRAFETAIEYDELGRTIDVLYPASLQPSTGEPTEPRHVTYAYDWLGRITAVGGSRGTQVENWMQSVSWHPSGLPAEVVHDNDVRDLYMADPAGFRRPSQVQTVWNTTVHSDTGPMAYDGRGQLCGHGQRSLVISPDELEPNDSPPPVCFQARSYDPFGLWNGEMNDSACGLANGPQPYVLFDPWDRTFGVIDLMAHKTVVVNGETQWVRDPANYTHTWSLYGVDGRSLRQVKDHYQGNWRETIDRVHGLSRVVGLARLRADQPGYVERYHKHPMMIQHTDWRGWARNPQF